MNTEQSQQPQSDVLLYVEQEAPSKFKIQSDQLERIGAKLRGPRRFSVFYSLILPALVTLLTTILTGTFQYLSWVNTVRLQAATTVADRATDSFAEATSLIGKRIYATVTFIPSVRDLANTKSIKPYLPTISSSVKTEVTSPETIYTGSFEPIIATPLAKIDAADSLFGVADALATRRFEAYYEQLKHWNEQYDQLLTDIDYNLDRPILADANITRTGFSVFFSKLKTIDCRNNLSQELNKAGLDKHSLKLQFAGINFCFAVLHGQIDDQMTKILKHSADTIDPSILEGARGRLDHIRTMANEFRCVALSRIAYYKHQKEKSIVMPTFIRRWLFDPTKVEAESHFTETDKSCAPGNRPT